MATLYSVCNFDDKIAVTRTVQVLNGTFPNVVFKAIEKALTHHQIVVEGIYSEFIHPHTLLMFVSKACEIYGYMKIIGEASNE